MTKAHFDINHIAPINHVSDAYIPGEIAQVPFEGLGFNFGIWGMFS